MNDGIILKMKYKTPEERKDGRAVVPIQGSPPLETIEPETKEKNEVAVQQPKNVTKKKRKTKEEKEQEKQAKIKEKEEEKAKKDEEKKKLKQAKEEEKKQLKQAKEEEKERKKMETRRKREENRKITGLGSKKSIFGKVSFGAIFGRKTRKRGR